jgi:hypothetical protein
MPYITQSRRVILDANPSLVQAPGELNYVITKVALRYFKDKPGYTTYNAIVGALECAKLELYRRVVAHYEDHKLADTGDVYPTCERFNGRTDF